MYSVEIYKLDKYGGKFTERLTLSFPPFVGLKLESLYGDYLIKQVNWNMGGQKFKVYFE